MGPSGPRTRPIRSVHVTRAFDQAEQTGPRVRYGVGQVVINPLRSGVQQDLSTSAPVSQTSHDLLCQLLRKVVVDGVQAGHGAASGIGSVRCRVSATLYALLLAHPVDREGRCRSCRRPGAVFGWRRRRCCWVYIEASYWLRQPEEFLHSQVVREWGLADQSQPGACAAPDRESRASG